MQVPNRGLPIDSKAKYVDLPQLDGLAVTTSGLVLLVVLHFWLPVSTAMNSKKIIYMTLYVSIIKRNLINQVHIILISKRMIYFTKSVN